MSEGNEKKRVEEASSSAGIPGEKTCFVIAPIGEPDSNVRRVSDQVFVHLIKAAVEPFGYKPARADHISEPGIITSQVIQHVVDSSLVIADLTGRNPNVFYELAIRHAIKRPLVQIIMEGEQIPFDVAGTRTIRVDIHDLDSVEKARNELAQQIRSIESGKVETDNPISIALDLKILRESENPEARSLADVVGAISELRSGILAIENKLKNPESLIPLYYLQETFRELTHRSRVHACTIIEDLQEIADGLSKRKSINPSDLEELREKILDMARRIGVFLQET